MKRALKIVPTLSLLLLCLFVVSCLTVEARASENDATGIEQEDIEYAFSQPFTAAAKKKKKNVRKEEDVRTRHPMQRRYL